MLTGQGPSDAVPWRFRCSEGRNCGTWMTIPVPSNWELQGFGRYDYGYRDDKQPESADYARDFDVPDSWRGRDVSLVFEGVMTDAQVTLNGTLLGTHQGAFTRFSFPISDVLRFGGSNTLEVHVDEASANESVNRAERDADYWVFGGIYRPVYLEARPAIHIAHVGIDAQHDGRLRLDVEIGGRFDGDVAVSARVRSVDATDRGGIASPTLEVQLNPPRTVTRAGDVARIEQQVEGIMPWSAEMPALYEVEIVLSSTAHRERHRVQRRFGFRTIQVHDSGLFVNGHRTLLKGVNRHAFWPTTGRALDDDQSWTDVALVRRMNANAIRTAHYPPDVALLEACDTIGIYVIDELSGWKEAYDTEVGRRLVREMVRRDAHHPSILMWANGNEGGWNANLDEEFGRYDPQQRPVIRPDSVFGGFDTVHYPSWQELADRTHGRPSWLSILRGTDGGLTMPTEMLHALYDGGGGAGLADYWSLLRSSPRGAGGFLWALFDEGVVRVDQDGRLDTAGADAPDGVVDPWRRPEPSFHAIRRVWSPVLLRERQLYRRGDRSGPSRAYWLANGFDQTNLRDCRLDYRWLRYSAPGSAPASETSALEIVAQGSLPGPDVPPGRVGPLEIPWPASAADVLELAIHDHRGRHVETFSLPYYQRSYWSRAGFAARPPFEEDDVTYEEGDDAVVLRAGDVEAVIDRVSGRLVRFARNGREAPIVDGPWPVGGRAGRVVTLRTEAVKGGVTVEARRTGALERIRWHLDPSGWLRFSYLLADRGDEPYVGVAFGDPDRSIAENIDAVAWLGRGQPMWANRVPGGPIDRYSRVVDGPIGYLDDVYWLRLSDAASHLDIVIEDDSLFVGVGTPVASDDARTAYADVRVAPLTFMHRISGIGTKFHRPDALGPPRDRSRGLENAAIWFRVPPD